MDIKKVLVDIKKVPAVGASSGSSPERDIGG